MSEQAWNNVRNHQKTTSVRNLLFVRRLRLSVCVSTSDAYSSHERGPDQVLVHSRRKGLTVSFRRYTWATYLDAEMSRTKLGALDTEYRLAQ